MSSAAESHLPSHVSGKYIFLQLLDSDWKLGTVFLVTLEPNSNVCHFSFLHTLLGRTNTSCYGSLDD